MATATSAAQRRRRHVKRVLALRNRFQFGQPRSTTSLVGYGNVACTDTAIQLIVKIAKGKNVTLNQVRRKSGGPRNGSRGLRPDETLRALKAFGLDYEVRSDLNARAVMRIARNRGPVIIAEQYWAHPQWFGFRYAGKVLLGWTRSPNRYVRGAGGRLMNIGNKRIRVGTTKPVAHSGLTQWTFRGNHAVLLGWARVAGLDDVERSVAGVRDSNHNSPSRPERPRWDEVTPQQLNRMMDSIRGSYGGKRLVIVPKRVVVRA